MDAEQITESGPSQSDRQELFKLVIARSDIHAALNTSLYVIEHVKDLKDELWIPLQDAVVISYSRPFTRNRPFGGLADEWGVFEDPQLQALHDELLGLRHQTIAHSDAEVRKVLIVPPAVDFGAVGKTKGLGVVSTTTKVPPARFHKIQELCLDVGRRLNTAVDERLVALYGSVDLPNTAFDLITLEAVTG